MTKFDDDPSKVTTAGGCTPPPQVAAPYARWHFDPANGVNPNASGATYMITITGDIQSTWWEDIEIDVGIDQFPAIVDCSDGIGSSTTYTVCHMDLMVADMDENQERSEGDYLFMEKGVVQSVMTFPFMIAKVLPDDSVTSGYVVRAEVLDGWSSNATTRARLEIDGAPWGIPCDRIVNTELEKSGLVRGMSASENTMDTRVRIHLRDASNGEVGDLTCRDFAKMTVAEFEVLCPTRESSGPPKTPVTGSIAAKDMSGNEFCFDTSATGVLEAMWRMKVEPHDGNIYYDLQGRMTVEMASIGGSTANWANSGVLQPYTLSDGSTEWYESVTWSTLPSANSEFGVKTWTLSIVGNEPSLIHPFATRDCEVFYYGTDGARNHPDNPPDTPNWYYYWKQSSHAQLSVALNYDPNSEQQGSPGGYTWWNASHGVWEVYIGPGAGGPTATWPTILVGANQGKNYVGIDLFMYVVRHERSHQTKYSSWYPNGPGDITGNDTDVDWLRDDAEAAAGGTASNPINGGPFYTQSNAPAGVNPQDSNAPTGWADGEDHARYTEATWSDTAKTAKADDWSRDGQNWSK